MLEGLRERVCALNRELEKQGLVRMTSGNVSGRDPVTGLVVIKPSGVAYDRLTPADLVVVDLEGKVVEGKLKPSVDTATHLYVYRARADVNGMVHTHSNYATAFAAAGRGIPCALTAMADEFGGAIPLGPYAAIGEEEIGKAIIAHIGESKAILLRNHGVFTIGSSPEAAVKSAVMVEDAARTCWLAMQLGELQEIPADEVARAHKRYREKYGQG